MKLNKWSQRVAKIGGCDCLIKNTALCKHESGRIIGVTPARCWKIKMMGCKLLIEVPVNGGRNYNGPKVAKFLVG